MGISKTSDHIQIKIKMPNPTQEPQAHTKAQNPDLKDIDVLCHVKFNIKRHNSENKFINGQLAYPNYDHDSSPVRTNNIKD